MVNATDLTLRDAAAEDIPALGRIARSPAKHQARIAGADGKTWRYLVALQGVEPVAFGCLLLNPSPDWPGAGPLPKVIDLCVREDLRCRGIGAWMMGRIEEAASQAGCRRLHLSVDPEKNPRALAFYRRLGYTPTTDQWQWVAFPVRDAHGNETIAHGWDLTLRKLLDRP